MPPPFVAMCEATFTCQINYLSNVLRWQCALYASRQDYVVLGEKELDSVLDSTLHIDDQCDLRIFARARHVPYISRETRREVDVLSVHAVQALSQYCW